MAARRGNFRDGEVQEDKKRYRLQEPNAGSWHKPKLFAAVAQPLLLLARMAVLDLATFKALSDLATKSPAAASPLRRIAADAHRHVSAALSPSAGYEFFGSQAMLDKGKAARSNSIEADKAKALFSRRSADGEEDGIPRKRKGANRWTYGPFEIRLVAWRTRRQGQMSKADKSLVFVVGAGASYEVKMPIGAGLKGKIAQLMDLTFPNLGGERARGDDLIKEALRFLGKNDNIKPRFLAAAKLIHGAMPLASSIDNFVDDHRSDPSIVQVGKIAIVRSILQAESGSLLFIDPDNTNNKLKFEAVEETWYNAFFQRLTEKCQASELEERFSKTAVVCFNYDRCIQHFLLNALVEYYRLDRASAATVLKSLEFHHPYGVVGSLPWDVPQKPPQEPQQQIEFGATPSAEDLVALSGLIKTFTEGSSESSDIDRVRELLDTADRIAFLGFAFHTQNVELLFPAPVKGASRRVLATGFGISDSDASGVSDDLVRLGGFERNSIKIAQGVKCCSLFREESKWFSLLQ